MSRSVDSLLMSISQSGHPFQGAEAKLNRAEKHLLDLDREIGQYLDAEPFGTVVYQRFQCSTLFTVLHYFSLRCGVLVGFVSGGCLLA